MSVPVTLLVPCHNAAEFLPRFFASLQESTRPFAEVICCDDGSHDDTIDVARRLGARVLQNERNCGVAVTRNRLALAAETEWFHFHDADDLLGRQYLERLLPLTAAADVVTCDADWLDERSRELVLPWRYDPAAMEAEATAHLLTHPMSLNNSLIRRSTWLAVGGCDESMRMWEDADVHVRMAAHGARFRHLAEVHSYALRRETSFSHDYRRSWNQRLAALERYVTLLPPETRRAQLEAIEQAAAELVRHRDLPAARRAIALAASLGGGLPRTRNPVVNACRKMLGPLTALRLQTWMRTRLAR